MALSGSFYKYPVVTSSHNFGLYCEWKGVQNISGNYTDVTMDVYLMYWSLYCSARSINGETETYTAPAISHNAGKQYKRLLKTYTVRVPHNSDGTKSCTLSASWRMDGTYVNTKVGTITASTTITLDTITRASTISSASNVTLGNSCSVSWTPGASNFSYKIEFSMGSWSYTTSYIYPNTTISYRYTGYVIPTQVSSQIKNASSGTMAIKLYTYNGSSLIGSSSKNITVFVPDSIKPMISSFTLSPDNSANAVLKEWGLYVSGYTKVKLDASAAGSYESTITSFRLVEGYSGTVAGSHLSYTGEKLSSSGSKTFSIEAVDSRGRVSDRASETIEVYPYSNPNIVSFTASRNKSDERKVRVRASWTFSDLDGRNSAAGTLMYKASSDKEWKTYGEINQNEETDLSIDFNELETTVFKIVVKDSVGNANQAETLISTGAVLLDFKSGGKGLGIGKIAETDNLEVGMNSIFIGNVFIRVGGEDIPLSTYIKNVMKGDYD